MKLRGSSPKHTHNEEFAFQNQSHIQQELLEGGISVPHVNLCAMASFPPKAINSVHVGDVVVLKPLLCSLAF